MRYLSIILFLGIGSFAVAQTNTVTAVRMSSEIGKPSIDTFQAVVDSMPTGAAMQSGIRNTPLQKSRNELPASPAKPAQAVSPLLAPKP